jgi:hypothetical protein
MLTLDRPQDANLKDLAASHRMRMRVLPNGPEVELVPGKTTVGSSPRCNIRIQLPGVQPLHCLILDRSSGFSVRRWAGETLINGEPLDESQIQPGDCLQVGPARLEVLSQENTSQCAAPVTSCAESNTSPSTESQSSQIDRNAQAATHLARSRARRLIAALRERQRQLADLNQYVAELEQQAKQVQDDVQLQANQLAEAASLLAESDRKSSDLELAMATLVQNRDGQFQLEIENLKQQLGEAQSQVVELQSQLLTFAGRETESADEIGRLEHDYAELQTRATELTNQVALLSDEVDETWRKNQALQDEVAIGRQREVELNQRVSTLELECARFETHDIETKNQLSAISSERDELAAECGRLREATERLPKIEQHLRDAIADRESTSSELYRALLRLAEEEDKAGYYAALDRAQEAVSAEIERSAREIDDLQSKVEKLQAERQAADEARHAHDRLHAELIEAHQQLAYDKTSLSQELADVRSELKTAKLNEHNANERSAKIEQLEQQLVDMEGAARRSSEELSQLQEELACKQQELCDAAAAVDERETRIAEFAGKETALAERLRQLERELADNLTARDQIAKHCHELTNESEQARLHVKDLMQRVAELEGQLKSAYDSLASVTSAAAAARTCEQPAPGHSSFLSPFQHDEQASAAANPTAAAAGDSSIEAAPSVADSREAELQPPQQGSFIERYAHMFADEPGNEAPLPKSRPEHTPAFVEKSSDIHRNAGITIPVRANGPSSTINNNDEESIEDYMAKLLQRVRGESSTAPEPAVKAKSAAREPVIPMTAPAGFQLDSLGASDAQQLGFHPDPSKRRRSMPAPQTDLEALRALANESARRAISRHAFRKHRRTATTKFIISVLAGATSALLILESGNWLSPEFISGGILLMVGAYWGGDALRVLIESHRVAAKDDTDVEIEELSREIGNSLPIDVDNLAQTTPEHDATPELPTDEVQPPPSAELER